MKEVIKGSEHLGFNDHSSSSSKKTLFKRSRVVLSDSDSSDELGEPIRRKVSKFSNVDLNKEVKSDTLGEPRYRRNVDLNKVDKSDELGEPVRRKVTKFSNDEFVEQNKRQNVDLNKDDRSDELGRKVSKFGNDKSVEPKFRQNVDVKKDDELGERMRRKVCKFGNSESVERGARQNVALDKSGNGVEEDDELKLRLSLTNGNDEEDFDEAIRLRRKTSSLKVLVNKDKNVSVGRSKESWSGILERKKVKLGRDVSEQRDVNKNLKPSRKKLISGKEGEVKLAKPAKPTLVVESGKEMDESDDKSLWLKASGVKRVELEKKDGNVNLKKKNVALVKGKESKVKGASCTEKQLLREKIKKMLFGAGWSIDYRPRRGRDYLDSVYISPSGTGYWSITKAYEALQKEEKNNSEGSKDFAPLPNEILSKLTRQTRKKAEKEIEKNGKHEGNNSKKSKREKVKILKDSRKLSQTRLKVVTEDSDDQTPLKDNSPTRTVRTNSHIEQGRKNKTYGRLALLVRGYDRKLNSENDESVPFSGKRTLISWLIGSGMVSVGGKVEYMNLRRTRVMQEGWITEDGIQCGCCSKTITILRFELHAGSKLGQPFKNMFVQSGKSLMQCQIDAWNKQKESERKGFHAVNIDGDDPHDDTCGLCGDGGDLICCDGCPSTFHLSCLDLQMLPKGDWHCPNCVCKYCKKVSGHSTKASGRTKSSLHTCRLCVKKYHKPCSPEMDDRSIDANDLNFTFCGQECRELYSRLEKLLWIKHELDSGFSWSIIRRSDPLPDASSRNFSRRVECNSKLAIALSVMDECFLPIVDRRSGITLIHNVVYNCGSNFSRLNYSGFFTAILERGEEMICAASIRIHGTQLAEMPFIGTRHLYRRQGMCRRLLHAIESALSTLEVEKLVIPAIEEHMHTWTNAFGFRPLEKSQKQELKSINMLVFPGTDLLQKPLTNKGTPESDITSDKGKKAVEAMQNGDYSTREPSLPEIRSSGKKLDAQPKTNGVTGVAKDANDITEGTAGADSGSNAEATRLQNGNGTATGITDGNSLQPKVRTEISCELQLQVTAKDSILVQNSNVTNLLSPRVSNLPLEPQFKFPR